MARFGAGKHFMLDCFQTLSDSADKIFSLCDFFAFGRAELDALSYHHAVVVNVARADFANQRCAFARPFPKLVNACFVTLVKFDADFFAKGSLRAQTAFGEKIRIKLDKRNKTSVDKFWEWTRKGAPLICEIGPRDVDNNGMMVRERIKLGTPEGKEIAKAEDFIGTIGQRLETIQHEMFARAKARQDVNIRTDIKTPEEFKAYFANNNEWIEDGKQGKVAFVRGKWNGKAETEEILKSMKINIRCIPFDQSGTTGKCLLTGEDATLDVIYARSY